MPGRARRGYIPRMRTRRTRKPLIEPGEWPADDGRTRVVVENPDRAELWAYAQALREAGYAVATCTGPSDVAGDERRCPLLEGVRCSLVEGADVVFTTCSLPRADELVARLDEQAPRVVVEASLPDIERYRSIAASATIVPAPVTEGKLLDALGEPPQRAG